MPSEIQLLSNDLRIACQQVSRRVRFEGTHEVRPHQFSVLVKLRERPRTPGELAALEAVSKPSMSRTVGCLADAGLVSLTNHPTDGRQKFVALTPEGEAVIERTVRERDSWMLQRLQSLTPEQRKLLRRATDVLNEVISQ